MKSRIKTRSTLCADAGRTEREYILADTLLTYALRLRRSTLEAEMAENHIWGTAPYIIHLKEGKTSRVVVTGRDRWALEALIAAGKKGCTPIDTPGPRWSGYVFNLRQLGVPIETVTEAHCGPFAGNHARYILRASVTRFEGADA